MTSLTTPTIVNRSMAAATWLVHSQGATDGRVVNGQWLALGKVLRRGDNEPSETDLTSTAAALGVALRRTLYICLFHLVTLAPWVLVWSV